ncbi:hypothetical protein ACVWZM_008331 [Bradyrhizobium sp. USDA 4501]
MPNGFARYSAPPFLGGVRNRNERFQPALAAKETSRRDAIRSLKAIALNYTLKRGKDPSPTHYKDLKKPYDKTVQTTTMLAANAAHPARLLKSATYPGVA